MTSVAVLDVGRSSLTALAVDVSGAVRATAARALPPGEGAGTDLSTSTQPLAVEALAQQLLAEVAAAAPAHAWLGLMVLAPRAAVVLTRPDGQVAGFRGLVGPEGPEPELLRQAARVSSLHDWLVARMTGVEASALPYACGTGLVDVPARRWSADRLERSGVRTDQLAAVVEAGGVVGELAPGWGVPATLPVVAGGVRPQLVAASAGGLEDGVLTVVTGPGGFAQLATATAPTAAPDGWQPAVHAVPGLWSLERPCDGSPSRAALVAQAQHGFGRPLVAVVEVPGHDATLAPAAAALVARAVGAHAHLPRRS